MNSFDSTDDKRVVNNHLRHQYRPLSEREKELVAEVKDLGAAFIEKLHEIGNTEPTGDKFGSRNLALSFGHVEDAVYRAVKHITT